MNAIPLTGWFLQSLAVGALATACVVLCPQAIRSRVRQAVPIAAFAALILLAVGLFGALPQKAITAPEMLTEMSTANIEWLGGVWLAGCVLFMLRLAAGTWTVWSILRSTQPIPGRAWLQMLEDCKRTLGLRGKVRLRLAGPGFVPSAAGLLRRTVLLPDEAVHWTHDQRRLVLLHELGHFRRGDLWAHALGRLACAVHWFNPFVWMLQRHIAVEREFACDELVVSRGAAPDDYATLLFEMATAARQRPMAGAAFLTMASPRTGKLEARVRRILEPARNAGRFLRFADRALCTLLAAFLLVCAACKPMKRALNLPDSEWTPTEIQARFAAQAFGE